MSHVVQTRKTNAWYKGLPWGITAHPDQRTPVRCRDSYGIHLAGGVLVYRTHESSTASGSVSAGHVSNGSFTMLPVLGLEKVVEQVAGTPLTLSSDGSTDPPNAQPREFSSALQERTVKSSGWEYSRRLNAKFVRDLHETHASQSESCADP